MDATANIATKEERIIDETYTSVFVLNQAQVASHLCATDEARKAMTAMRVRKNEAKDSIITESTDGKSLIQVTEKLAKHPIESYPLDVNPSETPDIKLEEPVLIPQETLENIIKGFPRRKNFSAAPWQRTVVVSVGDTLDIGRSDKQGKPQVDSFDKSPWAVYPPVDTVWPDKRNLGDAKVKATFDVKVLERTLVAMKAAGAELVSLSLWDDKNSLMLESVNQYGHNTARDVRALVMPTSNA